MDPQEGDTYDLPDGRVAVFTNGRWVARREGARPQAQQGYTFQPMQSPADRRAEAAAERATRAEERAVAAQERQVARDERADTRAFSEGETSLRKEFESNPIVRDYRSAAVAYGMIDDALGMETAAGDMAAIFAVMRMLDPTSVVREGEYATAQNTTGLPDQLIRAYNQTIDGQKLSPRQRVDFRSMGAGVLMERGAAYNDLAGRYRGLAEQYGFRPDNVAITADFAPGSNPRTAVDINDREAVLELDKGDWVLVDGEPRRLTGKPSEGTAEGRPVAPGIFVTENESEPSAFGAFGRSFIEQIPFARDIGAAMSPLGYSATRDIMEDTAQRDREMQPLARDLGGVAGFGASLAVPGGAVTKGISRLTGAGRTAATVGAGALEGAVYGAGTTRGGIEDRAVPTMTGAGLGAIGGAVASRFAPSMTGGPRGGSGVSSPRGQMVQTLDEAGVFLTPGQRMGGLGKTIEDIAARAPILGPAVRGARERGLGSLNRAVGLRALENVDEALPANVEPGGDMVQFVGQRLGQEFDKGYKMVDRFLPDRQLLEAYERIKVSAADLPESVRDQFGRIVEGRAAALARGASGEQVGRIRSGLSQIAAQYSKSPDPDQQMLGGLIFDVVGQIDDRVGRINPEAGRVLNNAREGYTDYIRMERASTAAGGRPFNAGQLESAVRQSDSSVRRSAMGRGEARMQDLSRAAREIMPDQFGNPGSVDTYATGALALQTFHDPLTGAAIAGGLGSAAIPYFAMGRKVLERLPANPTKAQVAEAAGQLDELARRDPRVGQLRDQLLRRAPIAATQPMVDTWIPGNREQRPSMTNPGF